MPESILIIAAIGAVLVGLAKSLPGIIWAIRCPPDSTRYKYPQNRGFWFGWLRHRNRDED